MPITLFKVEKIEDLTDTIKRIVLQPQSTFSFIAGQYLQVIMGQDDKRPFSIANAPRDDGSIELHIGAEPGNEYALQVIEKMSKDGQIDIEGGLGTAHFNAEPNKPIILLAGGTGFSYTWSILQQLLNKPLNAPVLLYWGTRSKQEMYAFDELTALAQQHPLFTFVPVLEFPPVDWTGKTGWVHQAVVKDLTDLSGFQVYVAGRFEMAKVVRDDFAKLGLPSSSLFGDAYAFI
jgi:aquacobalamin reductase/NAD(P)H-flavin reductase